jgi:hypothetical protein
MDCEHQFACNPRFSTLKPTFSAPLTPNSCRWIFESSFVTISGSRAKPGGINLANPGEAFQASDNIVPGLPFRRLEFAGLSDTKPFQFSGG